MIATSTITWEVVSRINGRPFSRCQIGWYVVPEARKYDQYGEYAADYWSCQVEAGRYPLYAYRECGSRWHSLGVTMPGVIVSGSWWNKLEPGQPRSVSVNPYAHSVAIAILEGQSPYELLPGIEARPVHFEHNGKAGTTYGIFADDQQF